MITQIFNSNEPHFTRQPALTPSEWAAKSINYRNVPNYETPFSDPFDPELMPFWQKPLEDSISLNIREVVVVKCTRAGGSENFLLTRGRYAIAVSPEHMFYVTGKMDLAQEFMEDRWKRGMGLSKETAAAYRDARKTEDKIRFRNMDLTIAWANSDRPYKQSGYPLIFCDEVSKWPNFGPAQIRKRANFYRYHHILFISSPDPTRPGNPENDPIIVLYEKTNRNEWFMPDPGKKGKWFKFEFGGPDEKHGLKWPDECKHGDTWDLDEVEAKAYYVTPHGTRINEDQRIDLMRAGEWRPTATSKRDVVTGYKVVAPMIPNEPGSFGYLAAEFLDAKYDLRPDRTKAEMHRNPVRVYFSECWAEAHREDQVLVHDETLEDRQVDYKGENVYVPEGYDHGIVLTFDVQKVGLWYVARAWSVMRKTRKVESSLVDWGTVAALIDVDDFAASMSPDFIGFDLGGFEIKLSGVADYCAQYTDQRHPEKTRVFGLRGSDTLVAPTSAKTLDAYMGRANKHGQALYREIMWNTDLFRSWLVEMMEAEPDSQRDIPWWIQKGIHETKRGAAYLEQVTSTKRVDGKWEPPGHRRDHWFDCECMQLVIARIDGLIRCG